jgi:hypothetical protein
MRVNKLQRNIFLAILLLIGANFVFAQEYRGTIAGKITDPQGSVIPNGTVTIRNIGTNIETTIKTNEEGSFTVPLLIPGKYSVSATANGFKTTVREQINLNVDDRLVVDIQLEVGTEAQQVTVVADTELIERGSVSTGTVISQREIAELPLPSGAAYELATQAPGVLYTGNPQNSGPTANGNLAAFRSNGAGGSQITLDGSPNLGFDGAVAFTPPSDAVSQFKIQTSSFDAQNGFTAGSTVNVAVKSGTNKFHGSGSYFERRKSLTANNFFSNKAGQERPDRKYYRFGGQVNGPVKIPYVYNGTDRTFFMFSFEKQYNAQGNPQIYSVPTLKMRTGDFSELLALSTPIVIYDPNTARCVNATSGLTVPPASNGSCPSGSNVTRTAFTGNIIPTDRINKSALAFLKLYPTPNQPGVTNNYFSNTVSNQPYDSYLARIDHNISANQTIFGKVFRGFATEDKYNFGETDDAFTRGYEYRTMQGGSVNYTATIRSGLILDIKGAYDSLRQQREPANPISAADLGFGGISAISSSTMLPRFNFTNYELLGPQRSDYNEGLDRKFNILSIQPTITQVYGNHTFRYGYDARRLFESRLTNGNNAGNFTFSGNYTMLASNSGSSATTGSAAPGRDVASFLLGIPTSGSIEQAVSYDVVSNYHGFFFHDDWRVSSKLNLNLGVRYELEGGLRDVHGQIITGYDPLTANPLRTAVLANYNALVPAGVPISAFQNLSGGLTFADSPKAPNQKPDYDNIQPRFGISYALNDKTVLRGGIGIFTSPFQLTNILQSGFTATTNYTATTNGGLTLNNINNPFPTGLNPATGGSLGLTTSVGSALGAVSSTGPSSALFTNDRQNANYLRSIIGIQRELPFQIGIDATVLYSRGYNLQVFNQLNYIPAQYLNDLTGVTSSSVILGDGTAANPGKIAAVNTALSVQVANPFRGLVPTNTTYNAATIGIRNLLTANPQFTDLVVTSFDGTSDYASLQLQARKRFTTGLSFSGSYTFSYDHEKVRKTNPQDAELTDTISTASRPHRFTFNSIYELPFGKKRQFGSNWNGWIDGFLGGWQVQALYEWQSGEPLLLGNTYYNGDPTQLKNRLGEKDEQGRRYGIDIPAFDLNGFFLIDTRERINITTAKPLGDANPNYNKAVIPGFGTNNVGSANTLRYLPLVLDNFRNQPFQKFDAGITKNFNIREGMKLQVRIEAINALNWVYFTGLGISPSVSSGNTFGYATSQRNLPRNIQLGARFTF